MKKTESLSQKVVFGGELEISDYLFFNECFFFYLNKYHLPSRDHSLCTQFPLKDQTFQGRQNKENINDRCARKVLKSPVLSAPGRSGQVQIQNSKSLGCSTAQCVSGAIPALSSNRHWTGIVMCLTWIHHIHSHFICLQPNFWVFF